VKNRELQDKKKNYKNLTIS